MTKTKKLGAPKALPIDSLVLADELQMREQESHEHIEDLAEAIKAGTKLPRVEVVYVSDEAHTGYHVVDGFHTVKAHRRAGSKKVPCDVRKGTWDEAILAAAAANKGHLGLKRTHEDKRKAVGRILDHFGREWTLGRIAEHVDVSVSFVSAERKKFLEAKGQAEPEEPAARVGADGKKYTTAKTPKARKPKQNPDADEAPELAGKPEAPPTLPTYREFEEAMRTSVKLVERIGKCFATEANSADAYSCRAHQNKFLAAVKAWLARLWK